MLLKRMAAAPLWYVATLMAYELVIYVTGGPHALGPILAGAIALVVGIDPLHRIWHAPKAPTTSSTFKGRDPVATRIQSI